MNKELKEELLRLLKEKELLIDLGGTPHDYSSVKDRVLQLELQQEINALREMLCSVDSFEEEFKKRCASRDSGEVAAIPFSELPQSATNSLYWEIALKVFQPENLAKMLEIVVPKTNTWIDVSLNDKKLSINNWEEKSKNKEEMKTVLKNGCNPVIKKTNGLGALNKVSPDLDELMYYVLKNEFIFDLRTINYYELSIHSQLYTLLDGGYLELAEKIYHHNSALEQLRCDIDEFNKGGLTPQSVIIRLIKCLRLGGNQFTGEQFAARSAQKAVAHFYEYLNSLPEDTLKQFKSLKYNGSKTLGDIIEDEIKKGRCVETTASHLEELLAENSKDKLLTSSLNRNSGLEGRYSARKKRRVEDIDDNSKSSNFISDEKASLLDTKKSILVEFIFPKKFAQKAVQSITFESFEDLLSLLLNFSPTFYGILWEHLTLSNPYQYLKLIAQSVKRGFFTEEQQKALAQAISAQYHEFKLNISLLDWADQTNSIFFFKEVLASYKTSKQLLQGVRASQQIVQHPFAVKLIMELLSEEDRLAVVKLTNENENSILHLSASYPESINAILEILPEDVRFAAITQTNISGKTLLDLVALLPDVTPKLESIKIILDFLSEEDRFTAVKLTNWNGNSLLHFAVFYPESIKAILERLPEEARFAAVKLTNDDGNSVLHLAASYSESIKAILKCLSEDARFAAVTQTNISGETLLDLVALRLDSIKVILELLPKSARLKAVTLPNKDNKTLLHLFSSGPKSIKAILDCLSEEDRFAAVKLTNGNGNSVLHLAASRPKSIQVILGFLSEEDLITAVGLANKNKDTPLHLAASYSESIKAILKCLSEDARFAAVTQTNISGETLLDLVALRLDSIKVILELLPKSARLKAVTLPNKDNKTLLHLFSSGPKSIKAILDCLSEEDRFAAVKLTNGNGNSVLHLAASRPKSIQVILGFLSEEDLITAVGLANKNKDTPLHLAASYSESIKAILERLPEDARFAAVTQTNISGETLLDLVALRLDSIKVILELLPKSARLKAVTLPNKDNNTLLHLSSSGPKSIKAILDCLSEEDRFTAVKLTNGNGNSLLHLAASRPKSIKAILGFLSGKDMITAVALANKDKDTPLHLAASYPESIKAILERLPEGARFAAVNLTNGNGNSVLHLATSEPECLVIILRSLPENKRLALLKTQVKFSEKKIHSVLKIFLELGVTNLSEDDAFENSLAPSMIAVMAFLYKQVELEMSEQMKFFAHKSEAAMLIVSLFKQDTFDDMKNHLEKYVSENPESLLREGLIKLGINSEYGLLTITSGISPGFSGEIN